MTVRKTALSVQTEERLDLAELVEACVAVGFRVAYERIPGTAEYDIEGWHQGRSIDYKAGEEDGVFAFFLRDVVRRILPGSYCIPTPRFQADQYPSVRVELKSANGGAAAIDTPDDLSQIERFRRLPRCLFGKNETECWARALVALCRAGLLPGGGA